MEGVPVVDNLFVYLAMAMTELLVAIHLFGWCLPHRESFRARVVLSSVVAYLVVELLGWVGFYATPLARSASSSVAVFLVFSLVVVVLVWCLHECYDASIWTLFFCATAAYTMQNLAYGMSEAVNLVIGAQGINYQLAPIVIANAVVTNGLVYALCFRSFIKPMRHGGPVDVEDRRTVLLVAAVILINIGFDLVIGALPEYGVSLARLLVLRLVHMTACVFTLVVEYEMLYNRHLKEETLSLMRMIQEEGKQYAQSKENIEAINIKCHDIRHQIRNLRGRGAVVDEGTLEDIAREVDIYDSGVKTGNEALDVILTEKGLVCEREGIALACIVDGSALGFMAPSDLYSLFGNAIDNAVEAVRLVTTKEMRTINVDVRRRANVVLVHVDNCLVDQPSFVNGLPQTTKADRANHGFGTKSIRMIAERYGGTVTMGASDGVFSLDVMLPAA